MRIAHLLVLSLPGVLCAGVTAYYAVTGSPWWLIGTALSLILAPNLEEK